MKKYLLSLLLTFSFTYAETITIVGDEWCPYNCKLSDKNQGFLVDITKTAFQRHQYDINYTIASSWENAITMTREGKYNAIIGAYISDAPDFIFPTNPQTSSSNSFFAKKGTKWHFQGIESLKDVTLGVVKDYSYTKEIDNYIAKNKNNPQKVQIISGNRAIYQNAKKLLYNTIDVMIEDPYVIQYYFKKTGSKVPFEVVGHTQKYAIYVAFSPSNKNSKKYANILSQEMIKMKEDGTLKRLQQKYGLTE